MAILDEVRRFQGAVDHGAVSESGEIQNEAKRGDHLTGGKNVFSTSIGQGSTWHGKNGPTAKQSTEMQP